MTETLEFNPPLKERDDLELIAIAHSTTDLWQQEAIDQAKKELINRGISTEYQEKVIKNWEELEKLKEIEYQKQLKINSTERYKLSEIIYVFFLSPLILTGKIYSVSRLSLTELYRENFKIKFRQRLILLILGVAFWFGSFYFLGFIISKVNTISAEKADIRDWENNRTTNDSLKK